MSVRHFPPTPKPWEVTPAEVRPSARDMWRGLRFYVPAWERGGLAPKDVVSGRVGDADDWGGDGGRLWTPDAERGHVITADDATTQDLGFRWAEFVPTHAVTCAILYRKTDTTARQTGAFGLSSTAGDQERCGAHLPYSDGRVYWDFGGTGSTQRVSYNWGADLGIDTDWHLWVFQHEAEPGYKAIWLDGIEKASSASGDNRTKSQNDELFYFFRHSNRASDLAQIGMFGMWDRVLSPVAIEQLTADPHAPVRRSVRIQVAVLGGAEPSELQIDDSQHGHTSETVTFADQILQIDDSQHGHTSDLVLFTTLTIQDSQHGHTSETVVFGLFVSDSQHGHTSEGVLLGIVVDDSQHHQRSETLALRRPVDSGAQAELEKSRGVAVTHVMEIHYEEAGVGKVLRLTTAGQDVNVTVEGTEQTFTKTPENVLRIGTVEVSSDMAAQGVELTLGGVDRSFISLVMADDVHFRGRLVKIWRVYLDPDAGTVSAVVPDSENGWLFHINDRIEFSEDWGGIGEPGTVTVTTRIVSRLAVLQQPTPVMTNMDSHNEMLERAGVLDVDGTRDEFFRRLPSIVGKRFRWGDNYPGA